jgi:hypothetical protein
MSDEKYISHQSTVKAPAVLEARAEKVEKSEKKAEIDGKKPVKQKGKKKNEAD